MFLDHCFLTRPKKSLRLVLSGFWFTVFGGLKVLFISTKLIIVIDLTWSLVPTSFFYSSNVL